MLLSGPARLVRPQSRRSAMPPTTVAPGAAQRNPRNELKMEKSSHIGAYRNSAQQPLRWAEILCAISWATNAVKPATAATATIVGVIDCPPEDPTKRNPPYPRIRVK